MRSTPGRTLVQKLGIAAGERVAVVAAPPGFAATLGALPAKATLTASVDGEGRPGAVVPAVTQSELRLAVARLAASLDRRSRG